MNNDPKQEHANLDPKNNNILVIFVLIIIFFAACLLIDSLSGPTERTPEEEAEYQRNKKIVEESRIAIEAWKPLTPDSKIGVEVRETSKPKLSPSGAAATLKLERPDGPRVNVPKNN